MRPVPFTEFRKNASKLLDRVEKGETIQIARHGKVVARVMRSNPHDPGPGKRREATPIAIPGKSLSRMIIEEREERDEFIYRCLVGDETLRR